MIINIPSRFDVKEAISSFQLDGAMLFLCLISKDFPR